MRIKKLLFIFLALALVLSLPACGQKETGPTEPQAIGTQVPAEPSTITPLLYKVTDGSGNCIWLFGSIHVGDSSFYPLPDYVMDAFGGADALAVEFDLLAFEEDMDAQTEALVPFMYTDGTTIRDHISEELYIQAVEVMTDLGLYMSLMDRFSPILWENMISSGLVMNMTTVDINLGIDRHLLEAAKDRGMEILDVESADFQYSMLAGFSPELQVMLLESTVEAAKDPEAYERDTRTLLEAWAAGDAEVLISMMEEEPEFASAQEEALYDEYTAAMMTDRNDHMNRWAEEALLSGKEVFVVVGAAHILSMNSMVEYMTAQGYTVEQVGP